MMAVYNNEIVILVNKKDKCVELEMEAKNMCRRKGNRTVRKMESETR
jgi:hypothetical protein